MEQTTSYLKKLRFDEKLKRSRIAKYLANPRLVSLLVLSIAMLGITAYNNLPRTLNPEIKIPIVSIITALPGANPADVESLITVPLEDALSGLENLKQVSSVSRDSLSFISLEFESGTDPEKAKTDVQSAADSVDDLPEDALTPRVQKLDFENEPIWIFSLSSRGDEGSLLRFAKVLKDELEEVASIKEVSTSGLGEREIQVLIKPEALSTYGLNPQMLSQSLQSGTSSFPAGSVKTAASSYAITLDPSIYSLATLRSMKVVLNGTVLSLSQIADVREVSKPDQTQSLFANPHESPKRSITFNVFKTATVNISEAVSDAEKKVDETLKDYKGTYIVSTVINNGESIDEQFYELVRDLSITIFLVFAVLFVFLGLRQAIVASLSIPLTFLITFIVMNITGIALSFISFFSFLLALGLLVDDTIVVISAMTAYYRTGKFSPLETALLVWRDFFVAIFTTTITTVWAFIPLLLSTGIIGEFIKPIPIVVSTTLLASIIVAMLITLPLIIVLLEGKLPNRVLLLLKILGVGLIVGTFFVLVPKSGLLPLQILLLLAWLLVTFLIRDTLREQLRLGISRYAPNTIRTFQYQQVVNQGLIHFSIISSVYRKIIVQIISSQRNRRMAIAMVVIFSLFSYLLLPIGFVKNEFFPKSDQDFMFVSLELPPGTNLETSKKETLLLLEDFRHLPGIDFVTADLGRSFDAMGGFGSAENNTVLFNIRLKDAKERDVSSIDIGEQIRSRYKSYEKGRLSVTESTGGPPAGADLQIKLFGDDLTVLDKYANRVSDYLKKQQGVTDVNRSIKQGTSKLVFTPDSTRLSQAGINEQQIGFWLRTFASGFSMKSVKFENDENVKKDVVFRMYPEVQTADKVSSIYIPTQQGPQPLLSLGKLNLETNPTQITREDSKRTLSVSASVIPGYSISTLNQELEKFANSLDLPQGYTWSTGGVNQENQNSVNSILQAMVLSFLLIIITMVIQFNSFRKALIVMMVIPLAASGVFIIFALTQTPLSFPALIGVLALFGIVVKNAILLVDKIIQNRNFGMKPIDAITDASESRLEAIALTSFTAIVGLIPITLSDPIWRGLGGAIIAGLSFSGTIMLFFIPVVYYMWFPKGK